jgi:hypothetical protein
METQQPNAQRPAMMRRHNPWLIAGAVLSALAALLHVGCIVYGAPWYRFFGAGEEMARMAEAGDWRPTLITSGITVILAVWSCYALSAAGVLRPLPWRRAALSAITGVYLLRGVLGIPLALFMNDGRPAFMWWSSFTCIGFGVVHVLGLKPVWKTL